MAGLGSQRRSCSVPADASAALQVRAVKDYCNNYDLTSLNVKAGDVITVSAAGGIPGGPRWRCQPLTRTLPTGAGAACGRALEGLHSRQPDWQRPRGLLPLQPRRGHKQTNRQIIPPPPPPRGAALKPTARGSPILVRWCLGYRGGCSRGSQARAMAPSCMWGQCPRCVHGDGACECAVLVSPLCMQGPCPHRAWGVSAHTERAGSSPLLCLRRWCTWGSVLAAPGCSWGSPGARLVLGWGRQQWCQEVGACGELGVSLRFWGAHGAAMGPGHPVLRVWAGMTAAAWHSAGHW